MLPAPNPFILFSPYIVHCISHYMLYFRDKFINLHLLLITPFVPGIGQTIVAVRIAVENDVYQLILVTSPNFSNLLHQPAPLFEAITPSFPYVENLFLGVSIPPYLCFSVTRRNYSFANIIAHFRGLWICCSMQRKSFILMDQLSHILVIHDCVGPVPVFSVVSQL